VRASNTIGHISNWSKPFTLRAAILPATLAAPAEGVTATTPRPLFEWSAVGGADSYTIHISTASNFSTLFLNSKPAGTTYTPGKSLPQNRTIYWRVRANGVNGPSLWAMGSFMSANPPSTPALVSPANNALNIGFTPRLVWRASSLPAGTTFLHYKLQVALDKAFSQGLQEKRITTRSTANYQFLESEKLNPNTRYYWRVQAWNTADQSSIWSAVRSFQTASP
jgi:hypothetical protein